MLHKIRSGRLSLWRLAQTNLVGGRIERFRATQPEPSDASTPARLEVRGANIVRPTYLLSAAMSGGLVGDFPDTVDPEQIVEVDKAARLIRGEVKAQLHRGSISHLGHRNGTGPPHRD